MRIRLFISASVLLLGACASGPSPQGAGGDRNLITREQIVAVPVTTAYDLIARLRPAWLRNRGPTSMRSGTPVFPLVYMDGVRTGNLEVLYQVSSQAIYQIQYINGRDATTKWGMDHGGGVILVETGR